MDKKHPSSKRYLNRPGIPGDSAVCCPIQYQSPQGANYLRADGGAVIRLVVTDLYGTFRRRSCPTRQWRPSSPGRRGSSTPWGHPIGPQWRTRHGTPTQSADRRIGSCTRRANLDQLLVVRHVSTTITHRAWIAEAAPKRKACCNVSNLQVSDGVLWPACRTPNQCASLRRCEWCTWVCGV
jgi:hypothetical protein